jgi:hypothetical protein
MNSVARAATDSFEDALAFRDRLPCSCMATTLPAGTGSPCTWVVHSVSVRADGTLWIWGVSFSGQGVIGKNLHVPTLLGLP